MRAALARRLSKLEDRAQWASIRRGNAAIDQLRATMDPEHAHLAVVWLQAHVDGKRHGPPCNGDPDHVCPRCLNRLQPPAIARAVWLMLLDRVFGSGAPVSLPPEIAEIYLNDPDAYPANPCDGCGYLMPSQCAIRPDGWYRYIGHYQGDCPVCGRDNHQHEEQAV